MTNPIQRDPDHWLYRFTADEWLRAARNEEAQADAAMVARQQRKGVANARRAAGMALNAVLVGEFRESWGRSYMDHLKAITADSEVPKQVQTAAKTLLATPLGGQILTQIGQLGRSKSAVVLAAGTVIDWAEAELKRQANPAQG